MAARVFRGNSTTSVLELHATSIRPAPPERPARGRARPHQNRRPQAGQPRPPATPLAQGGRPTAVAIRRATSAVVVLTRATTASAVWLSATCDRFGRELRWQRGLPWKSLRGEFWNFVRRQFGRQHEISLGRARSSARQPRFSSRSHAHSSRISFISFEGISLNQHTPAHAPPTDPQSPTGSRAARSTSCRSTAGRPRRPLPSLFFVPPTARPRPLRGLRALDFPQSRARKQRREVRSEHALLSSSRYLLRAAGGSGASRPVPLSRDPTRLLLGPT